MHRDCLSGGLAHQEGVVETGEQAGGERVGAGGHVDHHVFARGVEQMVEQQLDGSELGVEAGHAEVVLGERAGGQQPHAGDVDTEACPQRVVAGHRQQP